MQAGSKMSGDIRNAIVTGAGSGLGREIALRLARDGWQIAVADVDQAGAETTLEQVVAAGGTGRVELLDVTQVDQWLAMRERLKNDWPRLDLLANNAGVGGSGEMGTFSLKDWRWLLDVNLFGGIYGCHTMVDWLKENDRRAHILNTASFAAMGSAPSMAAYNISKAGMISLSETLYTELRPHRVGVTVLCPSFFQTNLMETGRFSTDAQRETGADYMRRAKFTAADVAEAAVRAVYRRRLYVVLGRKARVYWRLKRLFPMLFLNTVSRGYLRKLKSADEGEENDE